MFQISKIIFACIINRQLPRFFSLSISTFSAYCAEHQKISSMYSPKQGMFRCSYLTVCHTTNVWNFTQYVIKRNVWNSTCHITGPSQNSTCHQTYLSRKTSQNILYSKWYIKKILFCLFGSVYYDLPVPFCLSRAGCLFLAIQFFLSCSS
jgi:hypothetical protein